MKRRAGLPGLVFAALTVLVLGSVGPQGSAPSILLAHSSGMASAPALGLSDLTVADAPESASSWVLPFHYLFDVSGVAEDLPLGRNGPLSPQAPSARDADLFFDIRRIM